MTDRELLEAAAKAAEMEVEWMASNFLHDWATGREWNPLTDDGDALRLAVKLSLCVDIGWDKYTEVEWISRNGNGDCGEIEQDFDGDPYAATRRAIVRAAAAMVNA